MKKGILFSLIPLCISFLCFIILIISGIIGSIKVGPESILEKYEKAIKKGKISEVEKLCEPGTAGMLSFFVPSDLPYYGQNPNFIYEKTVEKSSADEIEVHVAVIYEEDGVQNCEYETLDMLRIDNKWYINPW